MTVIGPRELLSGGPHKSMALSLPALHGLGERRRKEEQGREGIRLCPGVSYRSEVNNNGVMAHLLLLMFILGVWKRWPGWLPQTHERGSHSKVIVMIQHAQAKGLGVGVLRLHSLELSLVPHGKQDPEIACSECGGCYMRRPHRSRVPLAKKCRANRQKISVILAWAHISWL